MHLRGQSWLQDLLVTEALQRAKMVNRLFMYRNIQVVIQLVHGGGPRARAHVYELVQLCFSGYPRVYYAL